MNEIGSVTGKQVFLAFAILVTAVVLIGGAPLLVAGVWGKSLPDTLISNSDKTVSGLIGILGTLVGLSFRRQPGDNAATENVGKAFEAITAAANSTPSTDTPQPVTVVNPSTDPVQTEAVG
jgi:hypothetical protein